MLYWQSFTFVFWSVLRGTAFTKESSRSNLAWNVEGNYDKGVPGEASLAPAAWAYVAEHCSPCAVRR